MISEGSRRNPVNLSCSDSLNRGLFCAVRRARRKNIELGKLLIADC
jgi:hypothetical protein